MTRVFFGIGSNIDKEQTISRALGMMRDVFGEVKLSPTFESEAVGFEGDNFFNLVAEVSTNLSLEEVIKSCKQIEDDCGRDRSGPKFSSRTIDIDVLLYGDTVCDNPIELPRGEILENAYVIWPMALLAPEIVHPTENQSMGQLWNNFSHNQNLWQVEIDYDKV